MVERQPSEITRRGDADVDGAVASLFERVAALVEEARQTASRQVNTTLVLRNWHLGQLVSESVLDDERGGYGRRVLATLSQRLTAAYGRGYEVTNLRRMVQFGREFTDEQIRVSPIRELSWTHILALLPLKSAEARDFYAQQAADQHLSVSELRGIIGRKAYERREIANAQVAPGSAVPQDTFKDPYLLDFLGLNEAYLERDLEQAIIRELEPFLLEVGDGWTFVARQKRMVIDGEDFYLDLLFFSRPLRRLVAVELKIGRFTAAHKGQLELYLRWLDRHERRDGEEAPLGLILCTETSREQIELLQVHKDGIVVAEYWTNLPPKALLEERLHTLHRDAQERIARRGIEDHAT